MSDRNEQLAEETIRRIFTPEVKRKLRRDMKRALKKVSRPNGA